jgi:hypothetical protein
MQQMQNDILARNNKANKRGTIRERQRSDPSKTHRNNDTGLPLNGLADICSNVGLRDGTFDSRKIIEGNLLNIGNKGPEAAESKFACTTNICEFMDGVFHKENRHSVRTNQDQ